MGSCMVSKFKIKKEKEGDAISIGSEDDEAWDRECFKSVPSSSLRSNILTPPPSSKRTRVGRRKEVDEDSEDSEYTPM